MKPTHGSLSVAGLGFLAVAFSLAGCGGAKSFAPSPSGFDAMPNSVGQGSPLGITDPDRYRHRHGRCMLVKNVVDFTNKEIKIGDTIWFSSVFSVPHDTGPIRIQMTDSQVQFSSKRRSFTVKTPGMDASLRRQRGVHLGFRGNSWTLDAPLGTKGSDFLTGVPYKVDKYLNKNIKNVTWTAKFFANREVKIDWQWGAAVYTKFAYAPGPLGVKPLDDSSYRPHNGNPAGTPENYKAWLIPGGTGNGDKEYTGQLGSAVSVSPCR